MPWKFTLCPDKTLKSFEDCLSCTAPCFDEEIREILFNENENQLEEHTGSNISVSALTGCLRQTYLNRIYDYAATPQSQWWLLRGTLIHKILELIDVTTEELFRRVEKRLTVDIEYEPGKTYPLSGQLDVYTLKHLKNGKIKDWKTIGDKGMRYRIFDGPSDEHIEQTNFYAYLCRNSKDKWKVDEIEIVYMSLMEIVNSGGIGVVEDYLVNPPKKSMKGRSSMIGTPMQEAQYGNKSRWSSKYFVPPVPVWSDEKCGSIIKKRMKILVDAFKKEIMPPKCDPEMQQWRCEKYCNVNPFCNDYERKQ
jgi:hypothetical protein